MDLNARISLRTKKLALLMRDMRQDRRRSMEECALAMGVSLEQYRDYEEARSSPSLPELELLVYFLELPIQHLWSDKTISEKATSSETPDFLKVKAVRQRMIGALLRREREKANLTIPQLAQQTGLNPSELQEFELGERTLTLPMLEGIAYSIDSRLDTFIDQSGPVGAWLASQRSIQKFSELPREIQDFVCQPVNRPYLDLAIKMSEMSKDRLRSVAEGLLDITL